MRDAYGTEKQQRFSADLGNIDLTITYRVLKIFSIFTFVIFYIIRVLCSTIVLDIIYIISDNIVDVFITDLLLVVH